LFVASVVWDVSAFEQWGVVLGKQFSQELVATFTDPAAQAQLDVSTRNLIALAMNWNK